MAKYNLIQRTKSGVVGGSAGDYYNQVAVSASQTLVKNGKASYPLARITTRAQSRAKVAACDAKECIFQNQHVRIEMSVLAAGTEKDRQEALKCLMRATSEAQRLLKTGAVVGFAPDTVEVDDAIQSLALNLTGASGVPAA